MTSPRPRAALRRILFAVAALLIVAALGVIMYLASDWGYWQRVFNMPPDPMEWGDDFYQPVTVLSGPDSWQFPEAAPQITGLDPEAVEAAAAYAAEHNSVALLVLHRGRLVAERYWEGMDRDTLYSGRAMSRTLIPLLVGISLDRGEIDSLDLPISTWLDEWANDPRGDITLAQLLENASGLENPPLSDSYFSKSMRLSFGTDFAKVVLGYRLEDAPGRIFQLNNGVSQLLGVILERATGQPYELLVRDRLWQPMGANNGTLYMDREGGMPAVYCCIRFTPMDWLRLGALMLNDGMADGRRVLPAGWVARMATPSQANPVYGLHIWVGSPEDGTREYFPGAGLAAQHSEPFAAEDLFFAEGGGFRSLWMVPSQELVILRLGRLDRDWDSVAIPNMILRGIAAD